MNNRYWLVVQIVITLILMVVLVTGCKMGDKSSSPGTIIDVVMTTAVDKNDRPTHPTDVFAIDTEAIFCSLKLSAFPPGAKIKATLLYMGEKAGGEVSEGVILRELTGMVGGKGYTSISFERSILLDYPWLKGEWPKGYYMVVLSADGQKKASASFTVK